MTVKIWDLNEDMEEISMRETFLDEVVIDDMLDFGRKIDTSGLLRYCEEIMVHNLKGYKEYAERHEDKYAVSFMVGFKPLEDTLNEKFYDEAWVVFKKRIDLLLKLFNLNSWRIGKGILDRYREDVLIIEMDGSEYPLWDIYFSLTRNMTYRKIIEMANILETYIKGLKEIIDNSLR